MTAGWDELVTGALVGTARRPPALPTAGGALGQVLAGLDRTDPEGALLAAGALLGLYRQAGRRLPVDGGPLPDASPPERRPYCSEAAAARLDALLAGRFRQVLPEWLGLAAGAGRLVPPDRLPALLDTATANPGLRTTAAEVTGERGRWLAGINTGWAWAAGAGDPEADPATWATGSPAARRLLLHRLRATDPAEARRLLESTWATETPEDRAAFVAVLAAGLSMDDEPFLEAALDDRRKEVRHAAAGLLWRLPDSRLGARMAERSTALVKGTRVVLADAIDAGAVRDGVVAKPPAGMGERAWWFLQLVAATPLRTWGSPAPLVPEADALLRRAWASAVARQRDEAWALALLDAGGVDEPALIEAVPHDRALDIATARVTSDGLTPGVLALLLRVATPWGPELSVAVVDRVAAATTRQGRPDAGAVALRDQLDELAARLDPSVAPAATAALDDHAPWWSDVVGWFVDLLTFRADMREELF